MDNSNIINNFQLIIEKQLKGKIGELSMGLIKKILQEEIIKNNNVAKAISRVRITIKLFVNEKLAEDISKEMKQLTGL